MAGLGRRIAIGLGLVGVVGAVGVAALVLGDGGNPTVIDAPAAAASTAVADAADTSASEPPGSDLQASSEGRFPSVVSRDLNDDEVELPATLPGNPTVVVFSFERAHQDPTDDWLAVVRGLEAEHAGLDHVQLAVAEDPGAMLRGTISFFMKSAIEDVAERARTIPIFADPELVAGLAGLSSIEDVSVVIVDRSGAILWRHTGAHDADAEAALVAALAPA